MKRSLVYIVRVSFDNWLSEIKVAVCATDNDDARSQILEIHPKADWLIHKDDVYNLI